MSDNTAAETLTPCKYHRFYESGCLQCAMANNDGGPFLPSPIPPQCELVDKAALDALREAVKGCGKSLGAEACGSPPFFVHQIGPQLCMGCESKRDAAINALLGEGGST